MTIDGLLQHQIGQLDWVLDQFDKNCNNWALMGPVVLNIVVIYSNVY
jgi:hypothetical protein